MNNTIEMRGVTKSFFCGGHIIPVLKDINMELSSGKITVIKGAEGTGKDTLLNVLGLLDKPTSGEFIWDDENISDFSDKELREKRNTSVGLIIKAINLIDKMTVKENAILPSFLNKSISNEIRNKSLDDALNVTGLTEIKGQVVAELSEFNKIKLLIARGLVNNPQVIVVDDLFEGLSNENKSEILEIFKSIVLKDKHVVIVSNNIDDVVENIYYFENGII